MKTTDFLIRASLSIFISLIIPMHEAENLLYSERSKIAISNAKSQKIAYISIDSSDFDAATHNSNSNILQQVYFWNAQFFKETFQKLLSLNPKAIVVSWPIPTVILEASAENALAEIAKHPKIFWASDSPSIESNLFSHPLGGLGTTIDSDGVLRKSTLLNSFQPNSPSTFKNDGEYRKFYSLAGNVANSLKENFNSKSYSEYFIHFVGSKEFFHSRKFSDIFSNTMHGTENTLKLYKDKIIVLALSDSLNSTPKTIGESHRNFLRKQMNQNKLLQTPIGSMTRSEVLANEVYTLVESSPIRIAPKLLQLLIAIAITVAGAYYIIYYPVMISALAIIFSGLFVLGVIFQLIFQFTLFYIPSANLALASLITYLIFTGYRLAFQENLQWRSLKQSQHLKEIEQLKSNFLSLISHDLKTPLAKLQAGTERLKRIVTDNEIFSTKKSEINEIIELLENNISELKSYILSILNLSKIESQKVIINKKPNDINRIIQGVLKRLASHAHAKQILLEQKLEPLFTVECDEYLLRQILTNLVDNAIKYCPAGSSVTLKSREVDKFIEIEVTDNGPGIPLDQIPFMFRKFSRYFRPFTHQVRGSGLGLYLSKYFIELHGGTIRFETGENKGTQFIFTIPIQTQDLQENS